MNQWELYYIIRKLNIKGQFTSRKLAEIIFSNKKVETSDIRKVNRYLNSLHKKGMIYKKIVRSNKVLYGPLV